MASTGRGPIKWRELAGGANALAFGFYLDGRQYKGGAFYPAFNLASEVGPALLPMGSGGTIAQSVWIGGDAPINLRPLSGSWQVDIPLEADYRRHIETAFRGAPVFLYPDLPLVDVWHMPSANTGQDPFPWKTSRRTPWHLAGLDHTTRAPEVFIDSEISGQLTITQTDPPPAGSVTVPTAGGVIETIKTDDTDTGTYLYLRYHPELVVAVRNVDVIYEDHNLLRLALDIEEHLGASYTPGVG